jgi:CubicO group peptidase (beta-lactamase class C family)
MLQSVLDPIINQALGSVAPAIQVAVSYRGELLVHDCAGEIQPGIPLTLDHQFDLASLTKLFVATAFMTFVEDSQIHLDHSISDLFPQFKGSCLLQPYEDPLDPTKMIHLSHASDPISCQQITFRDLLSHCSGLAAWRPLYRASSQALARDQAQECFLSYLPRTRVLYSDLGYMLLGFGLETLAQSPLDQTLQKRIFDPLHLTSLTFLPPGSPTPRSECVPTGFCPWRHRWIQGEVNDNNAAYLGGIAGHAGLFGSVIDLITFGQMFLSPTPRILSLKTIRDMTRVQAEYSHTRRGLGFALQSSLPQASSSPLSFYAFGHLGFTGTSLWIDPCRHLVIACLTNRVYYPSQAGSHGANPIQLFRLRIHQAIVDTLDSLG